MPELDSPIFVVFVGGFPDGEEVTETHNRAEAERVRDALRAAGYRSFVCECFRVTPCRIHGG